MCYMRDADIAQLYSAVSVSERGIASPAIPIPLETEFTG